MNRIEAVIFDWAGTTVDYGCFAPVKVFMDIFKQEGIEVTMEEARAPMGMLKIDHIREMLSMPRVSRLWEEEHGRPFGEEDVEALYSNFETALLTNLADYTDPIPHVIDTVETLRDMGLKIGSTTGYTGSMMEIVVPHAEKKGYRPDFYITADDTNSLGRPYPYMIFRNMEALQLTAPWKVVKVGDTASDMKEGVNAGVWTVGVIEGSSEMGLTLEEFERLSETEKDQVRAKVEQVFYANGADFTIRTIKELPELIEQINEKIEQGKRPYEQERIEG
ncbi:MAG: phosphonoacetaldehyde hydrolase [Bacillota bacterium]